MTSIGDQAFGFFDRLEKVTILSGGTGIGEDAFINCHDNMIVNYGGTAGQWTAVSNCFPATAKVRYIISATVNDASRG